MWRDPTIYRIFVFGALLGSTILPGCHTGHGFWGHGFWGHDCQCLADIPPGAIAQPLGTFDCQWQVTQAQLAEADDFVIYQYEWTDGVQPSPFGRDHLQAISERLQFASASVVIERSGDESLDQVRRQVVVDFLASNGYESPDDLVVIGKAAAEGLYGFEAPLISRGFTTSSGGGGQRSSGGGQLGGILGAGFGSGGF
jgi:hypothetical protein